MPILKVEITNAESNKLDRWKVKLKKSKRAIVREALDDFNTKQKNFERGLDLVFVRADHKQDKLDLD